MMKSQKLILLLAVLSLAFASCEKQELNEDELLLDNSEIIFATEGQVDSPDGDDDNLGG